MTLHERSAGSSYRFAAMALQPLIWLATALGCSDNSQISAVADRQQSAAPTHLPALASSITAAEEAVCIQNESLPESSDDARPSLTIHQVGLLSLGQLQESAEDSIGQTAKEPDVLWQFPDEPSDSDQSHGPTLLPALDEDTTESGELSVEGYAENEISWNTSAYENQTPEGRQGLMGGAEDISPQLPSELTQINPYASSSDEPVLLTPRVQVLTSSGDDDVELESNVAGTASNVEEFTSSHNDSSVLVTLPSETDLADRDRLLNEADAQQIEAAKSTGREAVSPHTAADADIVDHAVEQDEQTIAIVEPATTSAGPSREVLELLAQSTPATTGSPTGDRVTRAAIEKLERSKSLAARSAQFAARTELLAVLEMIASAKDAIRGSVLRTSALRMGLTALDEAEDFALLDGLSESAEEVAIAALAHQTPFGRRGDLAGLSATQAMDVYYRYAQLNLGAAVAGEPAGSMALHSLGKLNSRLAAEEHDRQAFARRRAFAYQQAALLARDDNYLAAHELGVLLAESGHYHDAEVVLRQVAALRGSPVVLRNLARVNRLLGQEQLARQLDLRAVELAQHQDQPRAVRVVTPDALAASGEDVSPRTAAANSHASAAIGASAHPTSGAANKTVQVPWYLR